MMVNEKYFENSQTTTKGKKKQKCAEINSTNQGNSQAKCVQK